MPDNHRQFCLVPREGCLDRAGYYRVSDYELATGWISGFHSSQPYVAPTGRTARAGFEAALLSALQRSPCIVAFSGGRDSSAVLAVATQVARREGLPDPVPATHDFAGTDRADERAYQEALIRHLQLREWQRFRAEGSCEVLGPPAQRGLLRHGMLWPATVHSAHAMIDLAAGCGSLVTGQGGDEVFGSHRLTGLNRLLLAQGPPRRAVRMLAGSVGPLPRRRGRLSLSQGGPIDYLRPDIATEAATRFAHDRVAMPLRWDRAIGKRAASRAASAAATNFGRLCADADVTYHEPFLDHAFLAPLLSAGGWRGWSTRTEMMRKLFGDVVPEIICARSGKAEFSQVVVGEHTRGFLADWQGEGIDPEIVDVEAFRVAATAAKPPSTVLLLIQAAWLATQQAGIRP